MDADALKMHLEAITGHPLTEDQIAQIRLTQDIALWTVTEGFVTQKSVLPRKHKTCRAESILDLSGAGSTGADAKAQISLADYLCGDHTFSLPMNISLTS